MRIINSSEITKTIKELCIDANINLPPCMKKKICAFEKTETNKLAKEMLGDIIKNYEAAEEMNIAICQDTGMAVVFAEIGQDVHIEGDLFEDAVNEGVRQGYKEGYLRLSIVNDPLLRINTNDNTPALIHTKIVAGENIKLTVAPKGFGSENMSKIKMVTPSAAKEEIMDFVVDTVKGAGGNPCPPIVVGVGIGSDFEGCALLSKIAICRDVDTENENEFYNKMEEELLERINNLDIGPQGFGGNTTALKVNIKTAPTHIAGLPVAVNIGCHVTRHKTKTI